MLLKMCNRCGNLIPYGATYCKACAPIIQKEREAIRVKQKREGDRRYNKSRDPKYIRFYNSKEWRILSAKYTQDKGYKCECCQAIATEVHHKKTIQTPDGWELRLDYNNLELLCKSCHNERHDRFKKRKSRRVGRSEDTE